MPSLTAPAPLARDTDSEEFVPERGVRPSESLTRIVHDMRGPLQTIMGFAELLSMEIGGPLTAEQQQYIGYIQRDAQNLLSLVDELPHTGT